MKRLTTLLTCLLMALAAGANGDPVAVFSALTLSRNPVGLHVPDVQLKDEHLTVIPLGRYTLVRVEYLLYNTGKHDYSHLAYGFPVDYYRQGNERWAALNSITEDVCEVGWRDDYLSDICFSLDGRQLPFQASADTLLRKGRPLLTPEENAADTTGELFESRLMALLDTSALFEYESDLMRRWFYTYLDIPAGKAVHLTVQYRIENTSTVPLQHKSLPLGFPEVNIFASFVYDFSPAAYWGNGRAETINVRIDGRQIGLNHSDETPETHNIYGLPVSACGDHQFCFTARDFDLAKAEPLRVSFLYEDHVDRITDLFNHRIPPSMYTVEVSGSAPKYPAANLSDFDLSTATVLRPDKNDSLHIVIRFKKPLPLKTVVFYNGYCKNPTVWRNNSRVDRMMVDALIGDDTYHLFCKYHNPSPQSFRGWQYLPQSLRTDIPDDFTWQGLTAAAEIMHLPIYYYGDEDITVTEVHFSIASVRPGDKSPDLCISEIILLQ